MVSVTVPFVRVITFGAFASSTFQVPEVMVVIGGAEPLLMAKVPGAPLARLKVSCKVV